MKIENISKYRAAIMGVALLLVACYHGAFYIPFKTINFLVKHTSYGGVDIFLFLSSFGLYFAYLKNNNLLYFYSRRILRIIPYFIPIMILYIIKDSLSIKESVLYLLTLDFWIEGGIILWYVPAIIVLYLCTPLYLKIFNKKPLPTTIIAIIISLLLAYLFIGKTCMIFISRLPIYLLGFYFGYLSNKKVKLNIVLFLLLIGFTIFGYYSLYYCFHNHGGLMWSYGLYWYPYFFIVPGLVLILTIIFDKIKILVKPFSWLGSISFEFYLINELMVWFTETYILVYPDPYGIIKTIAVTIATIILAKLYQLLINCIINKKTV